MRNGGGRGRGGGYGGASRGGSSNRGTPDPNFHTITGHSVHMRGLPFTATVNVSITTTVTAMCRYSVWYYFIVTSCLLCCRIFPDSLIPYQQHKFISA